jgi:perosamine synthetase
VATKLIYLICKLKMQDPNKNTLPEQIVAAIQLVVGVGPAVLHEPRFNGNEWAYVKACLDSTFVSSVGTFVERFESEVAAYTGSKHAIAVVNGTAALHIALMLAGVREGDEVLVPALTFVATANAVQYCGAIPHFIDCEEKTLGLAASPLREYLGLITEQHNGQCINTRTGRVIRAIVPMHTFGHPVEIDALLAIASDFNLTLVEDAAESLGSYYHGRHTGTFGMLGTLSFNGNKIITTGGGGIILTNDSYLAKKAKHLTTTAKIFHRWAFEHDAVGYNYRMPNINAALGCAQLESLSNILIAKRSLFRRYSEAFSNTPNVRLMCEPREAKSNYWLQTLLLDTSSVEQRDNILVSTNEVGLMTRPAWNLMHRNLPYKTCPRAPLPVAESLEQRVINLPSSFFLAEVKF